jgi:hypothetical protein
MNPLPQGTRDESFCLAGCGSEYKQALFGAAIMRNAGIADFRPDARRDGSLHYGFANGRGENPEPYAAFLNNGRP